jgi:type VI secretion system protein ImpG
MSRSIRWLPEVSLQYEPDGRSIIRLRFACSPLVGDWSHIDLSRLPLYLNADSPVACALHRALTLGTQQIWLRLPGQERCALKGHFSPRDWVTMTGSGPRENPL